MKKYFIHVGVDKALEIMEEQKIDKIITRMGDVDGKEVWGLMLIKGITEDEFFALRDFFEKRGSKARPMRRSTFSPSTDKFTEDKDGIDA